MEVGGRLLRGQKSPALLGLEMYHSGDQFYGGDGLVKKGVENTIATIGRLAQKGMGPTDKEIIRLMME